MESWLKSNDWNRRVSISNSIPEIPLGKSGIGFVVNSAPQHAKAAQDLLSHKYHVVIEKPLTFSLEESKDLCKFADERDLKVFASNLLLFNNFLYRFCQIINGKIESIEIIWTDPVKEIRYGESKSFDSGTPIIHDLLPHIGTIIWALIGGNDFISDAEVIVKKGGSLVFIDLKYGKVPINVCLSRFHKARNRKIIVKTENDTYNLDFSGKKVLWHNSRDVFKVYEIESDSSHSPLTSMMLNVLCFLKSGKVDARLDSNVAILGNKLIDAVVISYLKQQTKNLTVARKRIKPLRTSSDVYALREYNSLNERALSFQPSNSIISNWVVANSWSKQ
jgi:predicted dehydrogenase